MLHIKDLSFGFRHRPLFNDLTLNVGPGELIHLVGPNGAGKSTCMKVIAGLMGAQKGTVDYLIGGQTPAVDRRHYMEYLPAEANGLYVKMSATANLRFWAGLRGYTPTGEEMRQVLGVWGLDHPILRQNFPVEKYSTGMKRRLALARLQLSRTPCWLLDEPVYGLDTAALATFHEELRKHLKAGGMTLVISHDTAPLRGLISRTMSLASGVSHG